MSLDGPRRAVRPSRGRALTGASHSTRRRSAARLASALGFAAAVAVACGGSSSKESAFDDPFFNDGFGRSSLDEIVQQRAPSVGMLSDPTREGEAVDRATEEEQLARERSESGAGDVVEMERRAGHLALDDEADEEGARGTRGGNDPPQEKSLGEKAEEAALATMGVLIGAGMTALPYLLGT